VKQGKQDIKVEELGAWDNYANASASKALPAIYEHAKNASSVARTWYWKSIRSKRIASQLIRAASFVLLLFGAVLPILAGLSDDVDQRLACTQLGVAALAIAGLLQAGDRIFGWSSGWLRYITTVTAMEAATRKFELDWANYMISKPGALIDDDKRQLFEMAQQLEDEIGKLQSDETNKWVSEFNSSLAMLNDLIRSQRESAEKAAEAAQSAVVAKESAAAAKEKAQKLGGIQLSLLHKAAPVAVSVGLDSGNAETFTGTAWSRLQVTPGLHTVHVTTTVPTVQTIQQIVDVLSGEIAHTEVKLP
jgi:low affinity Fe/Cu permease